MNVVRYWQQKAELRTDGACRIMMMMMFRIFSIHYLCKL